MPLSPAIYIYIYILDDSENRRGERRRSFGFTSPSMERSTIREQRRSLPIASAREKLLDEVRRNNTLIVVGETGSGKTTQLPQYLHEGGFCKNGKMIGCTQPRRVAAITVASRVAEEMGVQLGQKVGYSIRFEDVTSIATSIKYMTDGMLLREALLDPLLSKYSVVVVDEAHERTIHTDVLLGLLKAVQKRRSSDDSSENQTPMKGIESDKEVVLNKAIGARNGYHHKDEGFDRSTLAPLKLVIMSATLDAHAFCKYFGDAKAVYIQGRQYPVQLLYTYTPEADYLDAVLISIFQIHLEEEAGDILVFLTGQEEIESMERLLRERISHLPEVSRSIILAPIYAALPGEQQMKVFKPTPSGWRKVILATNIAETSVTIPGIRYVIDPGLVKARTYNPRTGVELLAVVPVSKAQAIQRSGRAGREGAGKCFRIYTEETFEKLEDATVPEIKRCNLASVVLQLKALGINDVLGFDFMDRPSRMTIIRALEQLYLLGALTDEGKLSDPIGIQMARFPLEPLYAKAMLLSNKFNCSEEMLTAVAMLSVESVFFAPHDKYNEAKLARQQFSSTDGDHIMLVNVFRAYVEELGRHGLSSVKASQVNRKADKKMKAWCKEKYINGRSLSKSYDIRMQIKAYMEGMGLEIRSCGDDMTSFRRCLTSSFFLNAACKQADGSYRVMSNGQTVSIHPSSVLFGKKPDCVIFNELICTTRQYIRNVMQIDSLWLAELAPQYFNTKEIGRPAE